MASTVEDTLIRLLGDEYDKTRSRALHALCSGYSNDARIFDAVVHGWKTWGPEAAFPDFLLLSHFPIPAKQVEQCCDLAAQMAQGKKITDTSARCAGAIMEQAAKLPPEALEPHLELIESTIATSKIFFRVDFEQIRARVALLEKPSDALAKLLDEAIQQLASNPNQPASVAAGGNALEAIQLQHPEFIDLGAAIPNPPPETGPSAASFRLALSRLTECAQPGTEPQIAKHLSSENESTYYLAVEALVRCGTASAAAHLLKAFPDAPPQNRNWIARGLQRIRANGLAEELHALRPRVQDNQLWLMLLVAELNQFDPFSLENTGKDIELVQQDSDALSDALNLFIKVHHTLGGNDTPFHDSVINYLTRIENSQMQNVKAAKKSLQKKRKKLASLIVKRSRDKK